MGKPEYMLSAIRSKSRFANSVRGSNNGASVPSDKPQKIPDLHFFYAHFNVVHLTFLYSRIPRIIFTTGNKKKSMLLSLEYQDGWAAALVKSTKEFQEINKIKCKIQSSSSGAGSRKKLVKAWKRKRTSRFLYQWYTFLFHSYWEMWQAKSMRTPNYRYLFEAALFSEGFPLDTRRESFWRLKFQ